jgi:hypothetical protein
VRGTEKEEAEEVEKLELARSRLSLSLAILQIMLPYHFGIFQEPPHPNPTASFTMGPPELHPDQQHYDHHFFPGQAQYFNSETLEAVLRPPRAAYERELAVGVTTAPQQVASRNGGVSVTGQGHARARKRPFRTDSHSKIRTAQGVRDRRMRLSLDVARDFFALKDRLGFDKASKTVDWLLTQSKPAIDRLSSESSAHHGSGSGDAVMSSRMSAEVAKETAAADSGKGEGGGVEKAASRNSAFIDHGCQLDRLVAAAPVLREYYYDDGEYDEDCDFLDGMQY